MDKQYLNKILLIIETSSDEVKDENKKKQVRKYRHKNRYLGNRRRKVRRRV